MLSIMRDYIKNKPEYSKNAFLFFRDKNLIYDLIKNWTSLLPVEKIFFIQNLSIDELSSLLQSLRKEIEKDMPLLSGDIKKRYEYYKKIKKCEISITGKSIETINFGKENLSLLHFSDLHFGTLSSKNQSKYETPFFDFFFDLKSKIIEILEQKEIDIVLITGDITSKGENEGMEDKILTQFFRIFIERKIPIITCNGNHDLERDLIIEGTQFQNYRNFLNQFYIDFQCSLSINFDSNQSSFIYLEKENSIFISINTCKEIRKEYLKDKEGNITTLMDKEYLNVGIFSAKLLDDILIEIKNLLGSKFDYANKFLITHHPLDIFKENKRAIEYLESRQINYIFSGHVHHFDIQTYGELVNFVAGSPLVNTNQRTDDINLVEYPKQFNIYQINKHNKTIEIQQNLEQNFKWIIGKTEKKAIRFLTKYPLDNWSSIINLNEAQIKNLKNRNILYVVENNFSDLLFSHLFLTENNEIIKGILINNINQERIIKTLLDNIVKIKKETGTYLIINKTENYKIIEELPFELMIYLFFI